MKPMHERQRDEVYTEDLEGDSATAPLFVSMSIGTVTRV